MRRPIYVACAVVPVLFFASCENTDWSDRVKPVVDNNGIRLSSAVVTRSLINSESEIENAVDGHLGLFGSIETAGSTSRIFNNTDLAYNTSAGVWEYSPLQYWVAGSTYDFKAFWPYDSATANFNYTAADNTLRYSGGYVSRLSTAEQVDIMVATASRNPSTEGTATVQLPLKHALSAVRFSVRNLSSAEFYIIGQRLRGIKNNGIEMSASESGITWTSGWASGFNANTDQFVCSSSRSNTATDSATRVYVRNSSGTYGYTRSTAYWYRTFTGGIHTYVDGTVQHQLFNVANFYNTAGYVFDADGYLLFPPQAVTSDMEVEFGTCSRADVVYRTSRNQAATQVEEESYNTATTRTVALSGITGISQWEAGKKYDYLITVSTDQILLDVTLVPWVDEIIDL